MAAASSRARRIDRPSSRRSPTWTRLDPGVPVVDRMAAQLAGHDDAQQILAALTCSGPASERRAARLAQVRSVRPAISGLLA